MATDVRRRLPDLILKIVRDAPSHDAFQLIRMCESVWGAYQRKKSQIESRLRFRPAKGLDFPAADVRRMRRVDDGRIEVELNFMGLYGVDAAVPHYLLQTALRNDEAGEATRAFLDIFNHRFYVLLYQAWKKYHPAIDLASRGSRYFRYLHALGGRDTGELPAAMLPFTGLYGSQSRSPIALRGLLEDVVRAPAEVEQFVPRWVPIQTRTSLGGQGEQATVLGHNMVLGDRVLDVGGKINLHIGPVGFERAEQLLPGAPDGETMGQVTAEYLGPAMEFDLTLIVEGAKGMAPPLGASGLRLGWRAWLGEADGRSYPIHISGSEFRRRARPEEPRQAAEPGATRAAA
jgi:type VI secretion system protein ImpH